VLGTCVLLWLERKKGRIESESILLKFVGRRRNMEFVTRSSRVWLTPLVR
jgi:hypothetical protein